jgi:hypothetical protein
MNYKKSNTTILIDCEQERGESPRPHKRQKYYPPLETLSALLSLSKPTVLAKERPLRRPNDELPFALFDATNAGCFNIPNRVEEEDEGYWCEAKESSTAYSQPVFCRSFTNHAVLSQSSSCSPPLVTGKEDAASDTTSTRKRKMKAQCLPTILPAGRPLPAAPILLYALPPGVMMLQK